ncbi:PE-PPE domain-containing protein [Mycolicibacterium boenickei]|uniref:PE-PPE domain-containing protein n=1 Tax=Mycolicibacterium boenickei TaxID=146017 RepID=A0AAX3A0G1_9MYCO|nr:PE-PPE domain-containing protein [Mycolicibacterium boenickei]PEG58756.1 PE-PPE domain-containing protein [Mycolicibacterium boenickei]UNC00977.1 PE-PPE domain-containing protein [Mycolicibacterium boenickei]BBX90796.1 PE-PPE domain-containing protein [Mycolicibacterium boenickei]
MTRRWGGRAVPASFLGGMALVTVTALGAIQPMTAVQLSSLIIGASSTNPGGDGVADFYGGLYRQGQDEPVVANFFTGPFGIYQAIQEHSDDDNNVVLSSGWGAANASLLLTYGKLTHDPVVSQPTLYVLDNNVASPNGGFGTRLPFFALLGVNPIPTPTDPGVPVVNVVYEYDINSNVPAYLWNAPAMANSLMAYLDRRLNQDSLDFPIDAQGNVRDCDATCHATLDSGGTVVRQTADGTVRISKVEDTTYVGYESENLPLVSPLRALGEPGNLLADAATPALRAVVDYGYPDNDPLANPQKYTPARLIPTRTETERFVHDFTAGVEEGANILRDGGSATRPKSEPDEASVAATRPLLRKSADFPRRPWGAIAPRFRVGRAAP